MKKKRFIYLFFISWSLISFVTRADTKEVLTKSETKTIDSSQVDIEGYLNLLTDNFFDLEIMKIDKIIADNLLKTLKFLKKGYYKKDLVESTLKKLSKTPNFKPFKPFLTHLKNISELSTAKEVIEYCHHLEKSKEILHLERYLEKKASHFCRSQALQEISREINQNQVFSENSLSFFKKNINHYIKSKKSTDLAYFIGQHKTRPEILKIISDEISKTSLNKNMIPHQAILKEINIDENLTKLIQQKGLQSPYHQNVFYAEFLKLIDEGYELISKIDKNKTKDLENSIKYLKNFIQLNKKYLPIDKTLTKLSYFAKKLFREKIDKSSRELLDFIISFNTPETMEDALFFELWTYIAQDDFKGAKKIIGKRNLDTDDRFKQNSMLLFWVAYVLEKNDDTERSIHFFEHLITDHPLSFYAIMAIKKLLHLKPDSPLLAFYSNSVDQNKIFHHLKKSYFDDDYLSSLIRLKIWSRFNSRTMLQKEIIRLQNHSIPHLVVKFPLEKQLGINSDLHILNAKVIQSEENHLESFRYLYNALSSKEVFFDKKLLSILYPSPYFHLVSKRLKEKSIDPIIVLSLIRQESVFNPVARSRVGARGLMQLMPQTARRFKRSVTKKKLYNPELNISIGTTYFHQLMKKYDGNLVYVLSAYNAGESRVKRWDAEYFDANSPILKNIESIPFLETRNYVKLIFRNIFFYKLLLESDEEMTKESNKIYNVHLGFNQ